MRGPAGILAVLATICAITGAACAQPAPTVGQAAPKTDVATQPGTLSDKLSVTGGVIHPQGDVDPGIHKPAPATGTMPVIPPAGTRGGSDDVQPK